MAVVVAAAGCATNKPPLSGSGPERSFALLQVDPGPVALTSSLEPATFRFEAGHGRVESMGEGAAGAARAIMTTPNLGNPQLEAVVGAVEFVLAPFAAGYGAISSGRRVLASDKLAEANEQLTQAMRSMSGPEHLQELLLEAASQSTRRRLVSMEAGAAARPTPESVSAVVESTVEGLQLQRTGHGDDNYVLVMKVRARVVRVADGAVLFDRRYEFRSEKAMFVDWARGGGFESVAQTGYRDLAERMAKDVFVAPTGKPLQLGRVVGAKKAAASNRTSHAGLSAASFRMVSSSRGLALKADAPGVEFTALRVADNDAFEIHSSGAESDLLIEGPRAKEETTSWGSTETEWLLGGLENDQNAVVQAMACLAAVPLGLWEQTAGLLRRHSTEELESAQRNLKAVARRLQPHQVLAGDIARALGKEISQPVLLADEPFARPGTTDPALVKCSYQPTQPQPITAQAGPARLKGFGTGSGVEVNLVEVRLAQLPGLRSRLALWVDAQVTLFRKSDGQELYSFPISYRSASKPLKAWAAGNSENFRRELTNCCQEMGVAVAETLVSCGLVAPRPSATPVLARK
jgi:hypothetical protein